MQKKHQSASVKRTRIGKPISLVFDTSVLRAISPNHPPPEFKLLGRLATARKVRFKVPEMAAREWVAHRGDSLDTALEQLKSLMAGIRRYPSLVAHEDGGALIESSLHSPDTIVRLREHSTHWHRDQLVGMGFEIVRLTLDDLESVLDAYIRGDPPFSAKKKRDDLPDGLVLAGALRVFRSEKDAIFVCADERLRKTAADQGMKVSSNLAELLKEKPIVSCHLNPAFALWWEKNFARTIEILGGQHLALEGKIIPAAIDVITNDTIRHYSIPEDNEEAWVSGASIDSIRIDWDEAESLGEGLFEVPIEFDAEIDLEISNHRQSRGYEEGP